MSLTSDPNDPRLTRGVDTERVPQAEAYLVLSEEERAKGFVRPVRLSYVHVGPPLPKNPLRKLEPGDKWADDFDFFEQYPDEEEGVGRLWTQERLDAAGKGCGSVTTMNRAIAETYARRPSYYGATYCVHCSKHLPVGRDGEFVWAGTDERVGT